MASTSVLSPPLPIDRSSRRTLRIGATALALVLLAIAAVVIARVVQDSKTPTRPAPVTAVTQQPDAFGTMAQLNALVSTPEGRAALANEFGPASFGAQPSASSPTSPADNCPVVPGRC